MDATSDSERHIELEGERTIVIRGVVVRGNGGQLT